ncbi:hypothetical protein ACFLQO_00780 [Candidatus Aenigmatarchaeota archaeon]
MIRSIIFDLGGVVLKNKAEALYNRVVEKLGIDSTRFETLIKRHKQEMTLGKMPVKDFADIVRNDFNLDVDVVEVWKEAFLEVMQINEKVIDIVRKLKKNIRLPLFQIHRISMFKLIRTGAFSHISNPLYFLARLVWLSHTKKSLNWLYKSSG